MPAWAWAYESLWLLLPVAWLAPGADDLRRYVRGIAVVAAVGFGAFVVLPVAGPRPEGVDASGLYGLLVRIDSPLNSFPSLHVALAVYSVLFAAAVTPLTRWVRAVLWGWVGLIALATLATKQHYFVDLPAGAALGWAGHRVAWRGSRRAAGAPAERSCDAAAAVAGGVS